MGKGASSGSREKPIGAAEWPTETIDSFWARVERGGDDECWPWTAAVSTQGYGHFSYRQQRFIASRVSFELANGPIPAGRLICHHCDNPPCVNPKHLYAGTPADNMADCVERGRVYRWQGRRRGENNPRAKLTREQVDLIRRLRGRVTGQKLAERFSVSKPLISGIWTRRFWK